MLAPEAGGYGKRMRFSDSYLDRKTVAFELGKVTVPDIPVGGKSGSI